eukprot:TRINITY_DN6095_c0_g1_i1.p1 TRINITY_DN6095_c0_g1~~TRINITY_DN6095_c0_g1_i1.p1  ORF type:complete len:210 (+),score=58.98 TRINITY_DN6095_c0_g1_i1:150-779(+)
MFRVAELKDIVRLKPKRFSANRVDALTLEINKKYANKVIYKLGLVICLFDIQEIQESHIFPGDGSAHVFVKFRLIVFRPFVGEYLQGVIEGSTSEHIKVSLNFFRDIFIPSHSMREDMSFDMNRQVWVWDYTDEDGSQHKLDLAKGGSIAFKVMQEDFQDVAPATSRVGDAAAEAALTSTASPAAYRKQTPYMITGRIDEDGLGMTEWW